MASQRSPHAGTWNAWFLFIVLLAGCSGGGDDTSAAPSNSPTTPGGGSGTSFNQGSGFNGMVRRILLAQDGTGDVYVGGDFTAYNGTVAKRLIRLQPNGTVAQMFGQGFDGEVLDLAFARTGGGELYVQGRFTRFDGQPVPHGVIRLSPSGSLDATFRISADLSSCCGAIAAAGSGGLYTTFIRPNPNPTSPVDIFLLNIARLNPDGTVDPAFSTGNGFTTDGAGRQGGQAITVLLPTSTGKLYVGGSLHHYNGVPVSSLIRLNPDASLDSTFVTDVPYVADFPAVEFNGLSPVGDGTQDLYVGGRIVSSPGRSLRVHDTGATDTSYQPAVTFPVTYAISPALDGTGDVLVSPGEQTFYRFDRNGAVVSQFRRPSIVGGVLTFVPIQDGTGDFYIGGGMATYNGATINNFARIHADGSLASVVSGGP